MLSCHDFSLRAGDHFVQLDPAFLEQRASNYTLGHVKLRFLKHSGGVDGIGGFVLPLWGIIFLCEESLMGWQFVACLCVLSPADTHVYITSWFWSSLIVRTFNSIIVRTFNSSQDEKRGGLGCHRSVLKNRNWGGEQSDLFFFRPSRHLHSKRRSSRPPVVGCLSLRD